MATFPPCVSANGRPLSGLIARRAQSVGLWDSYLQSYPHSWVTINMEEQSRNALADESGIAEPHLERHGMFAKCNEW
jgi:hypothetical protein